MQKIILTLLIFVAVQASAQDVFRSDTVLNKILANEAYWLGLEGFQQGRLQIAALEFKRAVYYQPSIHNAYYYLCLTQLRTGNCSDALKNFIKAYLLNPVFQQASITQIETEAYNTDFQNRVLNIHVSVRFDSLTTYTFRFYGIDRYYLEPLELLTQKNQ